MTGGQGDKEKISLSPHFKKGVAGQDDFFQSRLKVLQKRLQELGARKVQRDGTWYWDLKPDLRPGEIVIF